MPTQIKAVILVGQDFATSAREEITLSRCLIHYREPLMASVSATFVSFGCSFNQTKCITASKSCSISLGMTNRRLSSLRFPRLRVYASAKSETVSKVMEIVKKQLALNDSVDLKPESKFSELGADSLDTVEIVMNLEEVFNITVEEDNSQNITTVQEAADLIEKLIEAKPTETTSEASA